MIKPKDIIISKIIHYPHMFDCTNVMWKVDEVSLSKCKKLKKWLDRVIIYLEQKRLEPK